MGTPMTGNPRFSKMYMGALPPSMGIFTAGPAAPSTISTTFLDTGKSMGVRAAT